MAFVKSKNIKVYPTAYRGQKEEDENKNKYNPESAFATESNISKIYSTLGYDSFVISKDYDVQKALINLPTYTNFEFILGGYYFKIINGAEVFTSNTTAYYAHIKLNNKGTITVKIDGEEKEVEAKELTKSTDPETEGYDVNNIAILGRSLYNLENSVSSQISNMTSLDNNSEYFTGLIINNDSSNAKYDFTLKLIGTDGKVDYKDTLHIYANNIINDYNDFESIKKLFTTDKLKTNVIETGNVKTDSIESKNIIATNNLKTNTIQSIDDCLKLSSSYKIGINYIKRGSTLPSGIEIKSDGYLDLRGSTTTQLVTPQFTIFNNDVDTPLISLNENIASVRAQKISLNSNNIDLGANNESHKNINLDTDQTTLDLNLIGKKIASDYAEANLQISYKFGPSYKDNRSLIEIKPGNDKTDIVIDANTIHTDNLDVKKFDLNGFNFKDLESNTPYLEAYNKANTENLTIFGRKRMIQEGLNNNPDYKRKKPGAGYDVTVTGALGPSSLYSFDGLALHNTHDKIVDLNAEIYLSNSGWVSEGTEANPNWSDSTFNTESSSTIPTYTPMGTKLVICSGSATCDSVQYNNGSIKNNPIPIIARNGVRFWEASNVDKAKYDNEVILVDADGYTRGKGFRTVSDRRLKTNIKDYKSINSILDMNVKSFTWKNNNTYDIGFIAQDLQRLFPELVSTDSNGYLSIAESKLVYLLLIELQKMKKELEELKK